jgi:pimeloyl-ACP methyl ester carboxylesterase
MPLNALKRSACAIAAAALAGLGFAAAAEPIVEPLDACFFDQSDDPALPRPSCGYVVAPENPDRPEGRAVKLGFMRLASRSAEPSTPLFMLAGGPGQSLIKPETLMLFADGFLGPILDARDVVILDQRGAPNSIPMLDCPAMYRLPWEANERGLDEAQMLEAGRALLAACVADARAAGVDLAQFNSVRIAADVDAARRALGYERIVYYGASYGAQLGQHVMRDFPAMLEAVILDGANSLSRKSWVEDRVRDAGDAMDALAALCAANARCAEVYDIPTLVDEAMALFDAGPIETTFTDPSDPAKTITMTLTETDLASTIFEFQTGQIAVRSLPAILAAIVADGRSSAAEILGEVKGAAILASRDATEGGMAMLMHMAVVCSDDPVVSADDLKIDPGASRYAVAYGRSVLEEYLEFCRAVDAPPLPDSTDVDVTTDVPTLILAGRLDARTPASRSEVVARALPHATLVTFPEGTHVQLGEINLCAGTIVEAFLADPKAAPDLRCILHMPRRCFVLPDGATSAE